ncbi:MAG: hypothetical protein NTW75_09775 [Planctomycetales bacterium]|nr:hypothetical protein [Planctomycetales bacterium]
MTTVRLRVSHYLREHKRIIAARRDRSTSPAQGTWTNVGKCCWKVTRDCEAMTHSEQTRPNAEEPCALGHRRTRYG